jgi:hypothetical protein
MATGPFENAGAALEEPVPCLSQHEGEDRKKPDQVIGVNFLERYLSHNEKKHEAQENIVKRDRASVIDR